MKRASPWAACVLAASVTPAAAQAPTAVSRSARRHDRANALDAAAERERFYLVRLASDSGLHYEWRLEEVHENGDTLRQEFRSWRRGPTSPARTAFAFSTTRRRRRRIPAIRCTPCRARLRTACSGKRDSFQLLALDTSPVEPSSRRLAFAGARQVAVRWRGAIAPVAAAPFLSGAAQRPPGNSACFTCAPTSRRGRGAFSGVLGARDSTYPRSSSGSAHFGSGKRLQTTRIELPLRRSRRGACPRRRPRSWGARGTWSGQGATVAAGAGAPEAAAIERELSASCRVELRGSISRSTAHTSLRLGPRHRGDRGHPRAPTPTGPRRSRDTRQHRLGGGEQVLSERLRGCRCARGSSSSTR